MNIDEYMREERQKHDQARAERARREHLRVWLVVAAGVALPVAMWLITGWLA